MENDKKNDVLALRRSHLLRFDPHDIDEQEARLLLQHVLMFIIFSGGFIATMAAMTQQKYGPGNTVGIVSIYLPLAAFVWEFLRYKFIGKMPDERLDELNHFRLLHTRVSLRALPLLFGCGVIWADNTQTVLILLYECATFAVVFWLVLTFGLRHAFLKRNRNTIIAAQRFAYG